MLIALKCNFECEHRFEVISSIMSNKKCVNVDQIRLAAGAMKELMKKLSGADQKNPINPLDQQTINLQICFKKVPNVNNQAIKVMLPNSLVSSTTDVCLFVRDLNDKDRDFEATIRHYKDLLSSKGVTRPIEVFPLKKLKLENQPYEAKRNLSNMYDVYLADQRIVRLLPSNLGKHFYSRKRLPMQVNLMSENLNREIERTLKKTLCVNPGRGSVIMMPVARTGMSVGDITCNIITSIQQLVKKLPGGAANVKNLHIKTNSSPAIPIYESLDGKDDIVLPKKIKKKVHIEPQNVTTVENALVKVSEEGKIQVIRNQKKPQGKKTTPNKQNDPSQKSVSRKRKKRHGRKNKKKPGSDSEQMGGKTENSDRPQSSEGEEDKTTERQSDSVLGKPGKRKREEDGNAQPEGKRKGPPPFKGTKRKQAEAEAASAKTPTKKSRPEESIVSATPVTISSNPSESAIATPNKGSTPNKRRTPKKGKSPNKGNTPQKGISIDEMPIMEETPEKGKTPNKGKVSEITQSMLKTPKKGQVLDESTSEIVNSNQKKKTPKKGQNSENPPSRGKSSVKDQTPGKLQDKDPAEESSVNTSNKQVETPGKSKSPKRRKTPNKNKSPNKDITPNKNKTPNNSKSPKPGKSPQKVKTM